ncbi:MAG: hypothetical protein ACE5DI_06120 [Candidatus Micrarchaeia archaeon]
MTSRKKQPEKIYRSCFGINCLKIGLALGAFYLIDVVFARVLPDAYGYLVNSMTLGILGSKEQIIAASNILLPEIIVGTIAWILTGYLFACLLCYSWKALQR